MRARKIWFSTFTLLVVVSAGYINVCWSDAARDGSRSPREHATRDATPTPTVTMADAMTFLDRLFGEEDENSDGRLSAAEFPLKGLHAQADRNSDGLVTTSEFKNSYRKRFRALNLPDGLVPLVPAGDSEVLSTTRMKQHDGLVAWVFDIEVKDAGKRDSLAIADFGMNIEMPASEILDLNCGTVTWGPGIGENMVGAGADFTIDLDDLTGRSEYVLRQDGKVVGMVGLVGDAGYMNPRYRGKAKPMIGLRDGRLVVDVFPPFKGRGGAQFRIFLSPLDEIRLATFRTMIASSDRFPGFTGTERNWQGNGRGGQK